MEKTEFLLNTRGRIPAGISGRLVFACGRRDKVHARFRRWQDSWADFVVIDLEPGTNQLHARILSATAEESGSNRISGSYFSRPNHAVNIVGKRAWGTNLHFGAPLEFDLDSGECLGIVKVLQTSEFAPQLTTTAHFAFTPDRRMAYFPQGLLSDRTAPTEDPRMQGVQTIDLKLVRLDTIAGTTRDWRLLPPPDDRDATQHNFHSAFYYERHGVPHVGLLRTGARFARILPHTESVEHRVLPMQGSSLWTVQVDEEKNYLQAYKLSDFDDPGAFALSHLTIDSSVKDGFVLYCNYKQADIAEETHGVNVYDEPPTSVWEHYSGMTVEAFNVGKVVRFDARQEDPTKTTMCRAYDYGRIGDGHTWLPINLALDSSRRRLFASFAGFRPRLLSRHIADAYPEFAVGTTYARYAPPLLMRLDAETLSPDRSRPAAVSYAEPMAFTLIEAGGHDYVCTMSTELGLRIYDADNLSAVLCEATAHQLATWQDSHFRSDPAHVEFVKA